MTITSDQCRAGRGLLNWSQSDLAINCRVAVATVAEFESNTRRPMKNNLLAMQDSMYAAGAEFIAENETDGAGVRFRERKLQYNRNVKIEGGDALMQMTYAGRNFVCVIPRELLEDHMRGALKTADAIRIEVSEMLHHILALVERKMKAGFDGERLVLRTDMFDPSLQ